MLRQAQRVVVLQRADLDIAAVRFGTNPPTGLVPDSVLDGLASDGFLMRWGNGAGTFDAPAFPWGNVISDAPDAIDAVPRGAGVQPFSAIPTGAMPVPRADVARQSGAPKVWLTDILFAVGFGALWYQRPVGRPSAAGDADSRPRPASFRSPSPPRGSQRGVLLIPVREAIGAATIR